MTDPNPMPADDQPTMKFGHRLRDKITGAIIVTALVITIIFLSVFLPFQERRLNTAGTKARTIMEIIAHRDDDRLANEIFEKRIGAVRLRLTQILKAEGLIHASVYTDDGRLLAQAGLPVNGEKLPLDDLGIIKDAYLVRNLKVEGGKSLEYIKALLAFGEPIGFIRMQYSLADVERERRLSFLLFGGLLVSILLCLLLFLNFFLNRTILKPIQGLGESMDTFAGGDLNSRMTIHGDDEIGQLGRTFNHMADRIQTQQVSLKQAEEKYRSIFENALEGIFQISPKGRLIGANTSLAEIAGYESPDDLIAEEKDILSLTLASEEERRRLLGELHARGRIAGFELELRRKDGTMIWGAVSLRLVLDPLGALKYYEGSLMDITARKEADRIEKEREAAEAATRAKGEFLARMSHEIRTPMSAVMGLAQLALRTDLDQRQKDYIEKIVVSAGSLLRIINDILDFSKIEQGRLTLEEADFEFDAVLSNLADIIGPQVKQKGLEVHFSVDSRIPPMLIGDSLRLGQVLINLTNNAIKFTEQGEILISASPDRFERNRIAILFSVRDTGPGLSSDQIDHLFQSFTQADESITRKYGGTGLGLAISKELVEMMGGRIWVESEPGQGSEFFFTAVFGISANAPDREALNLEPLRNLKVLVVDDNLTARATLSSMVTSFGWHADTASDGHEALARLTRAVQSGHPYNLVLMDWKMPGLDGIETSRQIKSLINQSDAPIILMVTAYDRDDIATAAEKAGLNGFLTKPVSRSLLLDSVVGTFSLGDVTLKAAKLDSTHMDPGLETIAGARVLLVEDNAINRQVAAEFLGDAGVLVDMAENGRQALDMLAEQDYHLVFMDIQMPVMDGLEAVRRIRLNDRLKKLPIVAMTAHALPGDRKKSIEAGMNDHISKPVSPKKLRQVLLDWIDPKSAPVTHVPDRKDQGHEPAESFPFFDLPGMDWAEGMKNFGGRIELYKNVLKDFYTGHARDLDALMSCIEEGRLKEGEHIAHSLKGVAALLGASELSWAAGAVERAVKGNSLEKTRELLPGLSIAFNKIHQGLAVLIEDDPQPPDRPQNLETTVDFRSAIDILEKMMLYLESGNIEADSLLDALNDIFPEGTETEDLKILNQALYDIEYEDALEAAHQLLAWIKTRSDENGTADDPDRR